MNYSPLEIYGIAIKSEVDAYNFYDRLAKVLKRGKETPSAVEFLIAKLAFLRKEEKKHRELLQSLYKKEFPKTKLILPKRSIAPLPVIPLSDKISLPYLLEKAMDAEIASERFYRKAQKNLQNERAKRILLYLSGMEKGHYYLLKAELELLNTFANYDSFKKFSLEHIGP